MIIENGEECATRQEGLRHRIQEFEYRITVELAKRRGVGRMTDIARLQAQLAKLRLELKEAEDPPYYFVMQNPALVQGPKLPPEELVFTRHPKLITRQQLVADWRFLRATVSVSLGHLWAYFVGRYV